MFVPNKKKSGILGTLLPYEDREIFKEANSNLLTIQKKVDILLLKVNDTENEEFSIISDNIKLLQQSFGFDKYIEAVVHDTVESIQEMHLIQNPAKIVDYVGRNDNRYKKKIMRIAKSRVLQHPIEQVFENIEKSARWRGVFTIENNQIKLNTYGDVENMIDLLDERYTRSDITGDEYDTDVKKLAAPRKKAALIMS